MTNTDLQLGDTAENVYSGTEGTVTAIVEHLTGCTRVAIRPSTHDPTEHTDDEFYYDGELVQKQSVHQRNIDNQPEPIENVEYELGNVLRDKLTGTEGIAVTFSYEFFNCPRVAVLPSIETEEDNEDEYSTSSEWFDLPRMEYVSDGVEGEYDEQIDSDNEGETGPIGGDRKQKSNPLR